jgi:predicted cupin superfamily sugar epimerase
MNYQVLIEKLGLKPLEGEGGLWASIFRSSDANAIYFMMVEPDFSAWHRIPEQETWVHLAGSPCALYRMENADSDTPTYIKTLLDRESGDFHATVQPKQWMAAKPLGPWSLLLCSLTPGFTSMELATSDQVARWARLSGAEIGELIHT